LATWFGDVQRRQIAGAARTRTVEENAHFKSEVRRKINIEDEAWKRMVPA